MKLLIVKFIVLIISIGLLPTVFSGAGEAKPNETIVWDEDQDLLSGYTVNQGDTLVIDPSVTVTVGRDGLIMVWGTIIADGTDDNPITFTSSQPSFDAFNWNMIWLKGDNNTINNVNIQNSNDGIRIDGQDNIITNNIFNDNVDCFDIQNDINQKIENNILDGQRYGIGVSYCDLTIKNFTIDNSRESDLLTYYGSLTVINSNFNTIFPSANGDTITIKNYLNIKIIDSIKNPIADADVEVFEDNNAIYSSSGYGGNELRTDESGLIGPIPVTYRIYSNDLYEGLLIQNITIKINVKYSDHEFIDNARSIQISESTTEIFQSLGTIPGNDKPNNNGNITDIINDTKDNDKLPEIDENGVNDPEENEEDGFLPGFDINLVIIGFIISIMAVKRNNRK